MKLNTPFVITPRLLPGVQLASAFVSLEYAKREGRDGRTRFQWYIDLPNGKEYSGDDLQSGACGGSIQSGFESLFCFLAAAGESYRYQMRNASFDPANLDEDSNAAMFPAPVSEWAYQNSDELTMLEMECQENPELITD